MIGAQNTGEPADRVDQHRVFQPSAYLDIHRFRAGVFNTVTHDAGGIT
jgi:hypothetical protein